MFHRLQKHFQHVTALVRNALHDARHRRSSEWPRVKSAFLSVQPTCAACGGAVRLNVHHIEPFHLDPTKELDPANFITLCMEQGKHCHLLIGHGDDFESYNPHVVADAEAALNARIANDEEVVARIVATAKEERLTSLTAEAPKRLRASG